MHRKLRNALVLVWSLTSLFVAGNAVGQMFVTFAPAPGLTAEEREIELASQERTRRFWTGNVALCAGMLALNTVALIVVIWTKSDTHSSPPTNS